MEKKRVPWTQEEDNILISHYLDMKSKCFDLLQRRSFEACKSRVWRLGLCKTRLVIADRQMPIKRWTSQEDNILSCYYPYEGNSVVERLPGRTVGAIQQRVQKLGLQRIARFANDRWSWEEDNILRMYYPQMGIKMSKMIPHRSKAAISNRATILGIKRVYVIKSYMDIFSSQ